MRAVEEARGANWEEFCARRGDWGRNLAWYIGWHECGLTQREPGEKSNGTDYATVNAAIKTTSARLVKDKRLRKQMKTIAKQLDI